MLSRWSPCPALNEPVPPESRIGEVLAGRLLLTGILTAGANGVVYNSVDLQTNIPSVVKMLNNNLGLEACQREVQLHVKASAHPNVVSLVKIIEAVDCTFLVMEYYPEGDLFFNIVERGRYIGDDSLGKRVFLQILDAVGYCHSIGIYHRDLKPENILVADDGMTVKLADFGLATAQYVTSDFDCGSTLYMSPECQLVSINAGSCYDSVPNDVWSLGVILVNLTCGCNPWERASFADSGFTTYMQEPEFLQSTLPISKELDAILHRIFQYNPAERISILELKELILRCPCFTTSSAGDVTSTATALLAVSRFGEARCGNGNFGQSCPVVVVDGGSSRHARRRTKTSTKASDHVSLSWLPARQSEL